MLQWDHKKFNNKEIEMKPSNDREAITLILEGLSEKNIKPVRVWDGDEMTVVSTVEEAVEAVTAVDEASVHVAMASGEESFIWFVLGNDPEEVACDYGVSLAEFIEPITDPWLD